LGPTPKFKIPLPRLFCPGPKVSKKVCHTPVGHKLGEEIDFLETGHFRPNSVPLRPADLPPPPKNYLYRVVLVLKIFYKDPFTPSKVIHIFTKGRQTDGRTDRQIPPIHIRAGEIFLCLFLIPFHFTTFASLTPFVKDNKLERFNMKIFESLSNVSKYSKFLIDI
jgi:hypothetical protein